MGARHAGEIEYVFQTLKSVDVPWTADDFKVSDTMSTYWVQFVKAGNPNGDDLPEWPPYQKNNGYQTMHLSGEKTHAAPEVHRARYEFLGADAERAMAQTSGQPK